MKVYISGKITGNPDYIEQFASAEKALVEKGWKVFNPTRIPDIFDYDEFMDIDLTALKYCDAIYMLSNWQHSKGAKIEYAKAKELNLLIFYEGDN